MNKKTRTFHHCFSFKHEDSLTGIVSIEMDRGFVTSDEDKNDQYWFDNVDGKDASEIVDLFFEAGVIRKTTRLECGSSGLWLEDFMHDEYLRDLDGMFIEFDFVCEYALEGGEWEPVAEEWSTVIDGKKYSANYEMIPNQWGSWRRVHKGVAA